MSDNESTDNTVIRDRKPPPPILFAAYSVGSAAIFYILFTIWQWLMCGCSCG